jgi:hypothetical protein
VSELPDPDIWRAANLLIQQYGEFARATAQRTADEMADRGDAGGQRVWERKQLLY